MFGRKVFSTKALTVTLGLAVLSAPALALETSANGNTDLNQLNALSTVIQGRSSGINSIINGEALARQGVDTTIRNNISIENGNVSALGSVLVTLNNLMKDLDACAKNPACVKLDPSKLPTITTIEKELYGGESGCVDWALHDCGNPDITYRDTQLKYATWQYCAIRGGEDSEDKIHSVYKRTNTQSWWLQMEQSRNDRDWLDGTVYARCFSIK